MRLKDYLVQLRRRNERQKSGDAGFDLLFDEYQQSIRKPSKAVAADRVAPIAACNFSLRTLNGGTTALCFCSLAPSEVEALFTGVSVKVFTSLPMSLRGFYQPAPIEHVDFERLAPVGTIIWQPELVAGVLDVLPKIKPDRSIDLIEIDAGADAAVSSVMEELEKLPRYTSSTSTTRLATTLKPGALQRGYLHYGNLVASA